MHPIRFVILSIGIGTLSSIKNKCYSKFTAIVYSSIYIIVFHWIIQCLVTILIVYISLNLKQRGYLRYSLDNSCLELRLEIEVRVGWERNLTIFKSSHRNLSWRHFSSAACGICISQFIRYYIPCVSYQNISDGCCKQIKLSIAIQILSTSIDFCSFSIHFQ